MVSHPVKYKDDLLERIGGTGIFDFLIISFSERIHDDPRLSRFYGNFSLDHLIAFQKELLMAALLEHASEEDAHNVLTRVTLRHYRLFELGLNEDHFDSLCHHFSCGLHDCWVPSDVAKDCETHFRSLRPRRTVSHDRCHSVPGYKWNVFSIDARKNCPESSRGLRQIVQVRRLWIVLSPWPIGQTSKEEEFPFLQEKEERRDLGTRQPCFPSSASITFMFWIWSSM